MIVRDGEYVGNVRMSWAPPKTQLSPAALAEERRLEDRKGDGPWDVDRVFRDTFKDQVQRSGYVQRSWGLGCQV